MLDRACALGLADRRTGGTVGLMVLSGPLLATLFGYGAFDTHDVRMTALSVIADGSRIAGLHVDQGAGAGILRAPGCAHAGPHRYLSPWSAIWVLNIVFVAIMLLNADTRATRRSGLANALSAYLNAGFLFRQLRKSGVYQPQSGWGTLFPKLLLANGVMGAMLLLWVDELDVWMSWEAAQRAWYLAAWVGAAAVVYFGLLHLMGLRINELRGFGRGK